MVEREPIAERQPTRRPVISYATYGEAQRAVDYLSDQGFPVERVSIVAEGIRFVEEVTGRLTYGQVALNGASSGALVGAFIGFLFGLLNAVAPFVAALNLALYGLIAGAIIGAIINVIFHALAGGQRDFTSVSGMQADHYTVMADEEVVDEASRLVNNLPEREQPIPGP